MIQVPEELCEWGSRAHLKRLRVGNFKLKSLRSCGHTGREFSDFSAVYSTSCLDLVLEYFSETQASVLCCVRCQEVKFSQILLTSLFAGSRSVWSCVKVPEMHIEKKKKNLCRKVEFWVGKSSSGRLKWRVVGVTLCNSLFLFEKGDSRGSRDGFHSCLLFIEVLARLFSERVVHHQLFPLELHFLFSWWEFLFHVIVTIYQKTLHLWYSVISSRRFELSAVSGRILGNILACLKCLVRKGWFQIYPPILSDECNSLNWHKLRGRFLPRAYSCSVSW